MGVNVDEESIAFCGSFGIPSARFSLVNAEKMAIPDCQFEMAYSHSVITHLNDALVRGVFRFLWRGSDSGWLAGVFF